MAFDDTDLYMMLLKLRMLRNGLDEQTVTPVLVKISVKDRAGAFISIHDHLRNRCRLMDGFPVLDRNSRRLNVKGDLVTFLRCRKAAAEDIQKVLFNLCVCHKPV